MEPIRVLIMDEQGRARQSLKAFLGTCPWIGEIKTVDRDEQAVGLVAEMKPDVVIMDLKIPEATTVEGIRSLRATCPHVKIIVLSLYNEYCLQALAAGADEFVSKGEPATNLLTTMEAAINRR